MSNEIVADQPSLAGSTLYANIARAGLKWNGAAFEAVVLADIASYAVAMTQATGLGYFKADMPAGVNTAGGLVVTVYKQAGGSPAASDPIVGVLSGYWTGAAWGGAGVPLTGDTYALANGANGFVAIKGNTAAVAAKLPANNIADETLVIAATTAIAAAVGTPMQAGASVTVGTNNDKTGYGLASTGLDAVSAADAAGVPSTFREKLLWLVRREWRASVTATQLRVLKDDGSTQTTQAVTDDNTTTTVGAPT